MRDAVERCHLDLSDKVILTEAATGAYAVTPVLAAMAGAEKVFAMTRETRHGTVEQVRECTEELAETAKVAHAIEIITEKTQSTVAQADIVTNSGHLRPIDAAMISWMKATAVISLMYEGWEFRLNDVDLAACRRRGIPVAGTYERHPAIDVFSFLGMMAVKLLVDAGIAVYTSRIMLLCDNPFAPFIERGLRSAGAIVNRHETLATATTEPTYDAILVALTPQVEPAVSAEDAATISNYWPGVVVAQFWGDIERSAFSSTGIPVWPPDAPAQGHMAVLPSHIGPEPIVRLQAGGLKVGELLSRWGPQPQKSWADLVQVI
jgi:hypothetical protein